MVVFTVNVSVMIMIKLPTLAADITYTYRHAAYKVQTADLRDSNS